MDKYVEAARVEDPKGILCGFCNSENDFADDCGWFYVNTTKNAPVCEECWKGDVGATHIKKWGLGDR